jgi:hypothetical protein
LAESARNTVPAADAVRVWRGFRNPSMALPDFFARLGTVFIPATVLMQIDAGLSAYIPSVFAGLDGKPDTVPDETAILYWESQDTYTHGFDTLAVRTYTLTHGAVYTPTSGAAFPVHFTGQLAANQPYHLTTSPNDWMHGQVHHLVGARPDPQRPEDFRAAVQSVLAGFDQTGAAGAIVCAADDHIVYWELHTDADTAKSGLVNQLAELLGWSHRATATPTALDHGLWDPWPGLQVDPGTSLNMQFRRRGEAL